MLDIYCLQSKVQIGVFFNESFNQSTFHVVSLIVFASHLLLAMQVHQGELQTTD